MRRLLIFTCCLLAFGMARGQTGKNEWRYWFDEDKSNTFYTSSLANGTLDIDVSALPEGLHSLHLQACVDDVLSAPETHLFTKAAEVANSGDYNVKMVVDGGISLIEGNSTMDDGKLKYDFDVSGLAHGLHTYQVTAVTPNGTVTSSYENLFVRDITTEEKSTMRCCYSIDNGDVELSSGQFSNGVFNFNLDVSNIPDGIHELNYWLVADNGLCTNRANAFFIKTTYADPAKMTCYYTVDNINSIPQVGTMSEGVLHFDLDVSQLSDGLHEVTYWVVADNGSSSTPQSAFFIKIPNGGTGIIEYEYWIDDDFANRRTITLDERVDPLSVITSIDVEEQEFSTSDFELVFIDGQPTICPVNDLHFRFTDVGGRMTDITTKYTDVRVTQTVEEIIALQPQYTINVQKPAPNTIRWFTADVQAGDSMLFRTNCKCEMRLFSPSGELVFDAKDASPTDFYGCEAAETGTYYLALNKVDDNNGEMAVTYRRPGLPGIGDVNGDGEQSLFDLLSIVDYILGNHDAVPDLWNADLNLDEEISLLDIMMLVDYILSQ